MKNNNSNNWSEIFEVIFWLVILLILYVVTFGKVENVGINQEFKDNKLDAKEKHKRLKNLIEKKQGLKQKLDKRFKYIYFGVRLCLVCLWFGIMSLLYYFNLIKDLGDFLNYSQLSVLILITFNFLTFGTITEVRNFIDLFKIKTENLVYGKYVKLEESIKYNKEELTMIENNSQKKLDIPNHK